MRECQMKASRGCSRSSAPESRDRPVRDAFIWHWKHRGDAIETERGGPADQLFDRLFPQLNAPAVIVSSAGWVLLLIAPSA
ncbi:hypothetical protein ABIB56_002705 [Glaciihabitans sp. UYNi722]